VHAGPDGRYPKIVSGYFRFEFDVVI